MEEESNADHPRVLYRTMTRIRPSANQEQILERDAIIRLYEKTNEENLKKIEKLKSTIKDQKSTIQDLLNQLNDKDEKMSSVNLLLEKIKSLESDKQFLKQRINILISAQNSSSTPKSSFTPRPREIQSNDSKNFSSFSNLNTSNGLSKLPTSSSPSTSTSKEAPLLKMSNSNIIYSRVYLKTNEGSILTEPSSKIISNHSLGHS